MAARLRFKGRREFSQIDRSADFVVAKAFQFNGRSLKPGEPFDKTQATTRTLRLLYESRKLGVSESKRAQGDVVEVETKPRRARRRVSA